MEISRVLEIVEKAKEAVVKENRANKAVT